MVSSVKMLNVVLIAALPLAFGLGRAIRSRLNWRTNEKCFVRGPPLIVLGASSGIGRAFAKYFALRGFNVIAAARRVECLNKLQSEVLSESENAQLTPMKFDLTSANDIDNLVTILRTNGCSGIINCAGTTHKVPQPL